MRVVSLVFLAALVSYGVFADEETASASVSASATPTPTPVRDTSFTAEQTAAIESGKEKFEFQAEVSRMMDIIINSLYTKVEIFLRELISNASDALDKIRFQSLADPAVLGTGDTANLEIRIAGDKAANTLVIRDRGIGMTKQDMINYLGTVAKSGTASLMEQLQQGGDLNLIGQFGVGFYSVYLVADRVRVVSKHNDDKQHIWESDAGGSYTIAEDPRGDTLGRGTEITIFLKESEKEYSDEKKLRELVQRYSEFITFPIYLETTFKETVEVPVVEEEAPPAAAEEEGASPSASPAAEGEDEDLAATTEEAATPTPTPKPKTKKEERETKEWEVVNDQKAVWARETKEVSDDEYKGFFRSMVRDESASPITWIHFKGEGDVEFRSILYTPSTAPSDLYENYYSTNAALRLYVRKVLISDDFEELLPRYLNFLRGVVDSDDLPLNVSREQLQQAKILKIIQKKLVRKALEMIKKLAEVEAKAWKNKNKKEGDKEEGEDAKAEGDDEEGGGAVPSHLAEKPTSVYAKFWEAFGKNIKLGLIEDTSNRSKLAKLLRFKSSVSLVEAKAETGSVWRSLDHYVANMKEGQKQIYFLAGESLEAVERSPFLERLKQKGLEVLFLVDPIDEYVVQNLPEFAGKRLQSIAKEGMQLPADEEGKEKRLEEAYKEAFKPLTGFLKTLYGDKVEKVTVSNRLAETPCVLVTSQFGYSANMERILRSQAFADPSRAALMHAKKIMEVNPRHPIIAELLARVKRDPEDGDAKEMGAILYDSSLLYSGFSLEDTAGYSARIFKLVNTGLLGSKASLELLPEMELPPEEAPEDKEEEGEAPADAGEEEL